VVLYFYHLGSLFTSLTIFLWFYPTLQQNVISFAGSKEITKENSYPAARTSAMFQVSNAMYQVSVLKCHDIPRFFICKFHEAGEEKVKWRNREMAKKTLRETRNA